ncbi:zinc finger protein 710-like [Hyalella azteca]|nr:zinc finger protein 710-like [Hyalella azteca]
MFFNFLSPSSKNRPILPKTFSSSQEGKRRLDSIQQQRLGNEGVNLSSWESSKSSSQTMHMLPDSSISCQICSKVFRGEYCKYNLKKHITIHFGIKPFSCPLCQRTFNQKSSMRRHLTFVHNTDPDNLSSSSQNFVAVNEVQRNVMSLSSVTVENASDVHSSSVDPTGTEDRNETNLDEPPSHS